MEMTGGEAVAAALETLGVRHVFGIVSVHNLPIYDAIARRGTVTPIGVRHEQAPVLRRHAGPPGRRPHGHRAELAGRPPVVGDARIGLELLLDAVGPASTGPGHAERARRAAAAARTDARAHLGEDHGQIMDAIRRHTPRESAIVRDAT